MKLHKLSVAAFITITFLTACGGGGTGSANIGSTSVSSVVTPPQTPVASGNRALAQFNEGVFFFGGAGSDIGGVDQSYIRKVSNGPVDYSTGNTIVTTVRYAGADAMFTNGLFDFVPRQQLGMPGWSMTNGVPEFSYGVNNAATLVMSYPEINMPDVRWGFAIDATDLNGTPINTYLQTLPTASGTPVVAGNFGAGAKSLTLTYTAIADVLVAAWFVPEVRDVHFNRVSTMAGLVNTTTCLNNSVTGNSLVMQYQSNGVILLYDTSALAQADRCTYTPAPEMMIGAASFVQKPYGTNTYLEITFPSAIDLSRYSERFSKTAFDAGVKFAIAQPSQGPWGYAYFIPQGAALTDPIAYMNREAADAVKSALGLR